VAPASRSDSARRPTADKAVSEFGSRPHIPWCVAYENHSAKG